VQKAKWLQNWTSDNTCEVWPENDVIEHKHKFTCPCNPTVEAIFNHDAGTFVWQTTHNSFDEFLDESEVEPYTGL